MINNISDMRQILRTVSVERMKSFVIYEQVVNFTIEMIRAYLRTRTRNDKATVLHDSYFPAQELKFFWYMFQQ